MYTSLSEYIGRSGKERVKETDQSGGVDWCLDICCYCCYFDSYVLFWSLYHTDLFHGEKYAGGRLSFVSKVAYGPKLPNTPLAVPFTHHTLPFTKSTKAYSEAVKWPYKRIAGTSKIKRNDIIVFNFPAGDTVVVGRENPDYYSQVRSNVDYFLSQSPSLSRADAEKMVREEWQSVLRL